VFGRLELELEAGAREKYYYLAGGWRLELKCCENEIL